MIEAEFIETFLDECGITKPKGLSSWMAIDRSGPGFIEADVVWSIDGEHITDGVYERADANVLAASRDLLKAAIETGFYLTGENFIKPIMSDSLFSKTTLGIAITDAIPGKTWAQIKLRCIQIYEGK